jgi:hypothetical protein
MALTKVFRIELTGGKDVEKDIISISKAMGKMAASIVKAKTELAQLVSTKADPAAISSLTAKITELETKFKNLSAQRKQAETDAKRQAEAEKILADARLKNAKATQIETDTMIAQDKELDRQIDREKKETEQLQKKKKELDAQPGSYNSIKKAAQELYAVLKNANSTSVVAAGGKTFNYDQAIAEYKRLSGAEQDFRRQFAKDQTLVGEYASGIVDAFKRLNIDDIIKNQVNGAKDQIGQLEKKTQELTVAYRQAQQQGSQDLNKLQKEIHDNVVETEALRKKVKEAEVQLGGVGAIGNQITGSLNKNFKDLKNSIGQFVIGYVGFQAVLSGLQGGVDNAKALSDQTTDLEINMGKAKGGADGLVQSLKGLDTRTNLSGLEEISNIALKAGTTEQNLFGVSRGIDTVKTAFGADFGSIEQGTETFVKLINIFYDDGQITEDRILKIGNSIRTLANETVASVPFINDFAGRMAGLRQVSNVTLPQIIGLGAGFEEFKQSAEVSSTVLVKVIPQMAKDIDTFAKIAGTTRDEFKKLLQDNPIEALLQVSQGLAAGKGDIEVFAKTLEEAGIDAGRAVSIISTLGGKADIFRDRIARAGTAIQSTDAITDAFNRKNENLAATLDKISKRFADAAGSKAFQNTLLAISTAITILLNNLGIIIGVVSVYAAIWAVANNALIITRISTLAANVAFKAQYAWLVITETATKAFAVANNFLSSTFLRAAASSTILTTAIKILSGPIGIILTILGLLTLTVTAFGKSVAATTSRLREQYLAQKLYNEVTAEAQKNVSETVAKETTLLNILKDKSVGLETQKKALADLIALNPQYLSGLTLQNVTLKEGQDILDDYNKALLLKAEREAAGALKSKQFQELTRLQGIKIQLEGLTAGGRSVGANELTEELEEFYKEVIGSQGKINLKLRKAFGGDLIKENVDAVTAELKSRISKQTELVNAADKVVTEIVRRDDLFNKSLLFKNFNNIRAQVNALKATLAGLKEGSAEYIKIQNQIVLKEAELETARNTALGLKAKPATSSEAGSVQESESEALIRLKKKLQETNDEIKAIDRFEIKSAEQLDRLKKLRKLRTEILKQIREIEGKTSGDGRDRSPEKKELDDALKADEAKTITDRNKLDEQYADGLVSEHDYYTKVRDITIKGEQDKINTIRFYQNKYKKALAQYNGDLEKDIAEAEKKQIQAKNDARRKLFDADNKQLEINLRNEQNAAGRDKDATLLNPELTNEQRLKIEEDYQDKLLKARLIFNQKQIDIEKFYAIVSIDNEEKRKEAIEKILKDLQNLQLQRPEAQIKDIQKAGEKQIRELNIYFDTIRKTILENNNITEKERKRQLDELNKAQRRSIISSELATLNIDLAKKKKLLEEGKISEEEYQKAVEAQRKKAAEDAEKILKELDTYDASFAGFLEAIQKKFKLGDLYQKEIGKSGISIGYVIAQSWDVAKQALQGYFQERQQQIEKEKQERLDELDREKERVKSRAGSKAEEEAIERQYAQRKKQIDKEAGEELKKQKKAEARIALAAELANIAVQAAANPANAISFGAAGIAQFAILSALALGKYLLRVGEINKAQFAFGGTLKRKFGLGGNAEVPVNGGVFGGKPHTQGGTDFEFGGQKFNAEVDEMNIIRTRNAPKTGVYSITGNQKQIASALNSIGGGVSFASGAAVKKFTTGGYLGSSLKAPYFSAGAYLNGGSVAGKVDDDRIERLEAMTAQVLEAVYATDKKPVILNPSKVTDAQRKTKKDISTGTL